MASTLERRAWQTLIFKSKTTVMTLPKFIGITELRNNVRQVFDRLSKDGAPIVVIRESKPEAVIVSYKEFETLLNGGVAAPVAGETKEER